MEQKPSRRVPEEKAASQDEIRTAIHSLTKAELLRLEKFARWRIRGLGRARGGRDWEDLLGEALTATLDDDHRRWNKSVSFVQHLLGAVRSISDAWKKKFDPDEAHLESEITRASSEREAPSLLSEVPSTTPDPERILTAKQEVEDIEQLFEEDSLVLDVIGGLRSEMTGPDIQKALGISQTEYETHVRRMRRKIQAAASKSGRSI